jgi:hypothetical protein
VVAQRSAEGPNDGRVGGPAASSVELGQKSICHLCVPKISSTSCDQVIFVDQATDVSVFSDAVPVEIDGVG